MYIPADAIIYESKLTGYLLVQRQWDDKSGFLHQAGFKLENWPELRDSIRRLTASVEMVKQNENAYGVFYRVEGELHGPSGVLLVRLIWMQRAADSRFTFVTLVPLKE